MINSSYLHASCFIFLALIGNITALASPVRTVIVTGANGYLGRNIVHNLLESRIPVHNNKTSRSSSFCISKILCLVCQRRVEEEEKYWKSVANIDDQGVLVLLYDMLDGGQTLSEALDHAFDDSSNNVDETDVECCVYHVALVFSKVE